MLKFGRAVSARFGFQADANTLATTGWRTFPFYDLTPPADPGIQDDPLLGGANNNVRDPITGVRELPGGQIRITVPLDLAMLPFWWRMAFGAGTAAGSSPNYTHAFASGLTVLPYETIEIVYTSGDVALYAGCMMDSWNISLAKDPAYARLEMVFMTKSTVYGTALISGGTPATDQAALKMPRYRGSATLASVVMGDLLEASLSYSNNLERYNTLNASEFRQEFDAGLSTISGSMRVRMKDRTLRNQSLNDVVQTLLFSVSHPSDAVNRYANLGLNAVRLTAQGPAISGPGGIDESFTFRGEQTSSAPAINVGVGNATVSTVYGY